MVECREVHHLPGGYPAADDGVPVCTGYPSASQEADC